jgi:hypothetical protein
VKKLFCAKQDHLSAKGKPTATAARFGEPEPAATNSTSTANTKAKAPTEGGRYKVKTVADVARI